MSLPDREEKGEKEEKEIKKQVEKQGEFTIVRLSDYPFTSQQPIQEEKKKDHGGPYLSMEDYEGIPEPWIPWISLDQDQHFFVRLQHNKISVLNCSQNPATISPIEYPWVRAIARSTDSQSIAFITVRSDNLAVWRLGKNGFEIAHKLNIDCRPISHLEKVPEKNCYLAISDEDKTLHEQFIHTKDMELYLFDLNNNLQSTYSFPKKYFDFVFLNENTIGLCHKNGLDLFDIVFSKQGLTLEPHKQQKHLVFDVKPDFVCPAGENLLIEAGGLCHLYKMEEHAGRFNLKKMQTELLTEISARTVAIDRRNFMCCERFSKRINLLFPSAKLVVSLNLKATSEPSYQLVPSPLSTQVTAIGESNVWIYTVANPELFYALQKVFDEMKSERKTTYLLSSDLLNLVVSYLQPGVGAKQSQIRSIVGPQFFEEKKLERKGIQPLDERITPNFLNNLNAVLDFLTNIIRQHYFMDEKYKEFSNNLSSPVVREILHSVSEFQKIAVPEGEGSLRVLRIKAKKFLGKETKGEASKPLKEEDMLKLEKIRAFLTSFIDECQSQIKQYDKLNVDAILHKLLDDNETLKDMKPMILKIVAAAEKIALKEPGMKLKR